ncbi:MAG: hypothetical protein ACLQMS_20205 [Desulfomonilaceae bacterium]
MKSDQLHGSYRRFFVRQSVLLVITVVLMVLFTIPLLKIVKSAMNPGELTAKVEMANKQTEGIQNEVDVVRSRMLMGAGDEEAQEKLKKQVEELQRQMESKEIENKHLQDQMALVQTMLQLVNAKSAPAATTPVVPPTVDFSQKLAELATKIFGCIGSLFSGGMFLVSWWRTRRKPPEVVAS